MSENRNGKSNYTEAEYVNNYDVNRGYTDSFYDEYESSSAGSFLAGALVGGVIGAAAALFLAPKTGKEMRDDLSEQAVHLKDKGIEISTVAKEKATEYTSAAKGKATEYTTVAKEKATEFGVAAKGKTDEVTKVIQEQSEQLVDKVKSMTSKTSMPMDDGTASSEGEEATEFIDKVADKAQDILEDGEENVTATAEALKDAVTNEKN
ncbi:YtxH domain-containing protein [Sporosarcina sp. G11-34]|uniref:YtxH domain-containing protein n=1 Tax=Sporosarcina sp. G11-34 TaxID=2849605 RepID=UPI0022A9E160|nr:YtxH domain-containing protein [Sporosarcina sp. G11-34]MCZ2257952.1 YtxH domain-containing protein [Sporosarcina sp. G11-34]